MLSSWCTRAIGSVGSSATCDEGKDRAGTASSLRASNIATGIGLIATYVYGVYDGAKGYRRQESVQPFVAGVAGGGILGINGSF